MRPQATRVIHLQAWCFMLLKFYIRIINCNWQFFFSAIFVTWCICAAATTAGLKTFQYIRDSQIVQSEMLEKISLSGKKIFFFLFLYQCWCSGVLWTETPRTKEYCSSTVMANISRSGHLIMLRASREATGIVDTLRPSMDDSTEIEQQQANGYCKCYPKRSSIN